MKKEIRNKNKKGQVALVVLLVSAVVMALGLSSARKTVVDTKVETDQQQLKQAFNAAESGIEYYLGTGTTKYTAVDSLSQANVVVNNIGNGSTINFDNHVIKNTSQEFWLVGHEVDGDIDYGTYYGGTNLSLCVDRNFDGAVSVNYFYRNAGTYSVRRYGYNLDAGYVSGYTDISPVQGRCSAEYEEIVLSVPLSGNVPLLLTVKPLKNGTRLYLAGSGESFPIQGSELTSTGKVGNISASSSVNRTLSVYRTYDVPGFALDPITGYGNVLSN